VPPEDADWVEVPPEPQAATIKRTARRPMATLVRLIREDIKPPNVRRNGDSEILWIRQGGKCTPAGTGVF
jgi:hypothetical protein